MIPSDTVNAKYRKKNRITKSTEILRILKNGKRYSRKCLTVSVLENELSKNTVCISRFACIVPKRIYKSAVTRNTIKRYARECFRREKGYFSGSFNVVVSVGSSASECTYALVNKHILSLFKEAGLYG